MEEWGDEVLDEGELNGRELLWGVAVHEHGALEAKGSFFFALCVCVCVCVCACACACVCVTLIMKLFHYTDQPRSQALVNERAWERDYYRHAGNFTTNLTIN